MHYLLFFLLAATGFSQNLERYNWYFGNSTQAIRFNRTSGVLPTSSVTSFAIFMVHSWEF